MTWWSTWCTKRVVICCILYTWNNKTVLLDHHVSSILWGKSALRNPPNPMEQTIASSWDWLLWMSLWQLLYLLESECISTSLCQMTYLFNFNYIGTVLREENVKYNVVAVRPRHFSYHSFCVIYQIFITIFFFTRLFLWDCPAKQVLKGTELMQMY